MEPSEYSDILQFLVSNVLPGNLQGATNKQTANRRDNFKAKARKFFVSGEYLYRQVPGVLTGVKVVQKHEVADILAEFHGSSFGGHSGINKTREAIKARYWWLGQSEDVRKYVSGCVVCQKLDRPKPAKKPNEQLVQVSRPFELVYVDLVGPLPTTRSGYKYIFTATDYFTKWVEAYPIISKTVVEVSRCFRKLFSQHGAVNAILTDEGKGFVHEINDNLCQEWNVQHHLIAESHLQTKDLNEKTNQPLKTALKKMVTTHKNQWDGYLDEVLFALRSKPICNTKCSPFFLLYGREVVYPSQLPSGFTGEIIAEISEEHYNHYVSCQTQKRKGTSIIQETNLEKAGEKQQVDVSKGLKRKFKEVCAGESLLSKVRSGESLLSEVRAGESLLSKVRSGESLLSKVRSGESLLSKVRSGESLLSKVRSGESLLSKVRSGESLLSKKSKPSWTHTVSLLGTKKLEGVSPLPLKNRGAFQNVRGVKKIILINPCVSKS